MRFSLAIAMLAAVLLARVDAHAGSAPAGSSDGNASGAEDAYVPLSRIVIERCGEQPMSLALQIAEAEAARDLTARSLTSLDEPVVATPAARPVQPVHAIAPAPKPFSPTPHACTSPGEPGCEVSAPFQAPHHTQLPHAAHDGVLLASIPDIEPPGVVELAHPTFRASDAPTDAHAPPPWRPPAR
jgi:hypothetical protein